MNVLRVSALIVAVGAGAAALVMARGMDSDPAEMPVAQQPSDTAQVLVAARDIAPGRSITADDLRWDEWPLEALSPRFVSRSDAPEAADGLAGSVARATLAAGEPIRPSKLIRAERGGYMSAVLPPGKRAVSMSTSPQTGAGGFILPNDRVDVILIRPDADNTDSTDRTQRYTSERVLQNIRVMAIDQTVEEQDGRSVVVGSVATLELTPSQVETLTRAQKLGELSLALRSVLDGDPIADAPATRQQPRAVNVVKFGNRSRRSVN